ncbi:KGG domain-containing protein [Singulisphaera sp. PoT]|uniref:KGG domain-containing protein n=1 Tax=Singulisphaera sp. PoT TaxID=3411797 RepID=UPI003BF4F351
MQGKSRRGFASMDPDKRRAISSQGGRLAHIAGRAHKFNSQEASEAGKIGGRAVSRDREHMAEIGRLGGLAKDSSRLAAEARGPIQEPPSTDVREEPPGLPRPEGGQFDAQLTTSISVGPEPPSRQGSSPPVDRMPVVAMEASAVDPAPMRVLMENGPFAGCVLQFDGMKKVPCSLWFDRGGMVTSAVSGFDDHPEWFGLVVEPVPIIDMVGPLKDCSEFVYEKTPEREKGFAGVFRFTDSMSRMPPAWPRRPSCRVRPGRDCPR